MGNDGSWIKENIKRGGQGEWKDDLQGYLDLDGFDRSPHMKDDDISYVVGKLNELHVKTLSLGGNDIKSAGAIALFSAIRENKLKIKDVLLYCNLLDDTCMESLGEYIKSNEFIENINIACNQITDKGIDILTPNLIGNKTLRTILLFGNKGITDNSFEKLRDLAENSKLEFLSLAETSMSEKNQMLILGSLNFSSERASDIVNHLLKNNEGATLNRTKIITAGDGRAGKTSTIRSLAGEVFIKDHPSTIGANANEEFRVLLHTVDNNWKKRSNKDEKSILSSKHQAIAIKKAREREIQKMLSLASEHENVGNKKSEDKGSFIDIFNNFHHLISNALNFFTNPFNKMPQSNEEANVNVSVEVKGEVVKSWYYNDELESELIISIWDLGGQKVFYTLHHLFLTDYAVYLVVFNMTHLVSSTEEVKSKALENIRFWMQSINMHASKANIFMIGTFKDIIHDHKQHKQISEMLIEMLITRNINMHNIVTNLEQDLLFWPLNNSLGPDNEGIKELRKHIMNITTQQEYLKEIIPLRWTITFNQMLQTKRNHMKFNDFNEIANKYGVNDEGDQLDLLTKFHELGMLLYFDKGEAELRNVIVLNPQWLVDALTKVIRDFKIHPYDPKLEHDLTHRFRKEFITFKEESLASSELLNTLWRDEDEKSVSDFTRRRYLLSLMQKMTLAVPWMLINDGIESGSASSNNIDESFTYYLIPSNLRLFGEEITKKRMMEIDKVIPFINIDNMSYDNANDQQYRDSLACIVIDFRKSFVPIGLFDRLICKLLAYSSFQYRQNRIPIVANGSILMSIGLCNFRIDEDLNKNRIIFTIHPKREQKQRLLAMVEFAMKVLSKEIMKPTLEYKILVGVRIRNHNLTQKMLYFVDINNIRNAIKDNCDELKVENLNATDQLFERTSNVQNEWIAQEDIISLLIRIPSEYKINSDNCEVVGKIGDGRYANVYRIKMKGKRSISQYAFKQFITLSNNMNAKRIKAIENEIELLSKLKNDNIVEIIGAIGDPDSKDTNDKQMGIGIVMEYCEKGSFRSLLDKNTNNKQQQLLNMDLIIHLLFGVAQGLEYLHNHGTNGLCHGDIRSDNMLIDKEYNAKLCDFGMFDLQETSNASSSTTARSSAGIVAYKAPETFDGEMERTSDVYSFGCVILEMLTGERPWNGLNEEQITKKVLNTKEQHDLSKVREDAKDQLVNLMKRCLEYDKDRRPSIRDVRIELEKMMNNAVLIALDNTLDEYNKVENLFFPGGGDKEGSLNRKKYKIMKIDKIRHLFAERKYDAELSNTNSRTNGHPNERLMFHGTSRTDPMEILNHPDAFMKDYSSQGYYGRGLYFAELARYSNAGYQYNIPNTNQYQMLVCSVICGNPYEFGNTVTEQTKDLSQKDLGTEYHSVHAGPHRPSKAGSGDNDSCMYVVYKDTQVLPKYIISYKKT